MLDGFDSMESIDPVDLLQIDSLSINTGTRDSQGTVFRERERERERAHTHHTRTLCGTHAHRDHIEDITTLNQILESKGELQLR